MRRIFVMLAGAGLLSLAACSSNQTLLRDDLRLMTFAEIKDEVVARASTEEKEQPSAGQVASAIAGEPVVILPAASTAVRNSLPAQCDFLREDAAARTDIMRSPTLRGSYNDSGQASLGLGMSLTDLGKAQLIEDEADVRCRLYMAEAGLKKIVFLSPQGLTAAGFRAKAETILARRKMLADLKRQARRAMEDGDIDREKATFITASIDKLMAAASEARSQADRRTNDLLGAKDNASVLSRELLRAEADLHDLNSRLRTYDSVDVSLSAGWNDDLNSQGINAAKDDFSGKVNFSVKLGALLPSRFNHEEQAKQARLKAIGSEEGGMLWQVNTLRLAHERAIQGLVASQGEIEAALAEARNLSRQLADVANPEFVAARISAKVQVASLEAERAGISSSIQEIRRNMTRLKLRS